VGGGEARDQRESAPAVSWWPVCARASHSVAETDSETFWTVSGAGPPLSVGSVGEQTRGCGRVPGVTEADHVASSDSNKDNDSKRHPSMCLFDGDGDSGALGLSASTGWADLGG
jgi:hypothetical protein